MTDLMPCPFCGSPTEKWKHHIESSGDSCPVFHVGCRNDACAVKPAVHIAGQWGYPNDGDFTNVQANEIAVEQWNTRVMPAAHSVAVAWQYRYRKTIGSVPPMSDWRECSEKEAKSYMADFDYGPDSLEVRALSVIAAPQAPQSEAESVRDAKGEPSRGQS